MKLIEYKPNQVLIVDVSVLPKDMDPKEISTYLKYQRLEWIKKNVVQFESNKPWVHPDYVVKEIDFNSEIKEKTFSELIEIIKEDGPIPDSMKGNSFENLYWGGHDPIDNASTEVWEIAKPKFNEGLKGQFRKPILFGTSGSDKSDKRFDDAFRKITSDLQHQSARYLPNDYSEIYYMSENPSQMNDWLKRKKERPILTVLDLLWVDRMVDKIFEKHTSPAKDSKEFWGIKHTAAILMNKFIKPLW